MGGGAGVVGRLREDACAAARNREERANAVQASVWERYISRRDSGIGAPASRRARERAAASEQRVGGSRLVDALCERR